MRKIWLLAFVLSANWGTSVLAAPAPKEAPKSGPLSKVTRAADKLFKSADTDQDGHLSPEEFKKADQQIASQIRKLTTDRVIGGATPVDQQGEAPALDASQAVSPEQFRSHFTTAAITADAELRNARVRGPHRSARAANSRPAPVASGSGRRPADDETTAQRQARERREQQQQQQQQQIAQMRAAQERDSFRPTPPPRERPTPSRGESGGGFKPQGGGGGPSKPGPGGKR